MIRRLSGLVCGVVCSVSFFALAEVLDNKALLREDPTAVVGGVISELQVKRIRIKYEGMSETLVRIIEFPDEIVVLRSSDRGIVDSTMSREMYQQLWANLEQHGLWQLRTFPAGVRFSHFSQFVVTGRRGEQHIEFTAEYPPLLIPSEQLAVSDQRAAVIREIAIATGWIDQGDGLDASPGSYTVFGGRDPGEQQTHAAP